MWQAKLRIRHNCIFDDRCEKFEVEISGFSYNTHKKNNYYFTHHFGTVIGEKKNIALFFKDIKKDKRVDMLEIDGNIFFILEKRKTKETPGEYYTPELIYTKPVIIDKNGWETWELASLKKETITKFAKKINKCEIISIQKSKLRDIYFPRLSPNLSNLQKKALYLAMKEGYYDFPKKIDLNELSRMSNVSRATFREHLRKAEKKILGEYFQ